MRRTLYFAVATSLVTAFLADFGRAESTAELVRAAKGQAQQINAENVADAKVQLLEDIQTLESHLDASPAEQATALRELVKLDTMIAELAKEKPSRSVLGRSLITYRGDEPGLEAEAFTAVRKSLGDYTDRLYISAIGGFAKEYDRRIDLLATQLETYEAAPSTKQATAIGRSLEWFDRAGQIASVTAAIRERHSHPNLHVVASKQLVGSSVRDTVYATEALRECILGTSIHGTASLSGNVDLELVSSDEGAVFDITLAGNAVSNNVGYNRGVSIYSTGYTNLNASKRVYFDAEGLTYDWATATAATNSNVSSIGARCNLVRRIAWKQVWQKKAQAERIASGRAAGRVANRVDGRAGPTLAEADENFHDKFRSPLVRRDSFPERLDLKTTNTQLLVHMLRAGMSQLAVPGPAPDVEGDFDLAARVHESIAGNFSESMIGGVMLTDQRIVEMYEQAEIEVPEDLKIPDDDDEYDAWAITFSRSQPISVQFANGGVKISVLCQYLHQGDEYEVVSLRLKDKKTEKLYHPEILIAREYDLATPNDGGLQLVSKGDLSVSFIDNQGETVEKYGREHAAAVGVLSKKFNAMLKPQLPEEATDGFTFKGRWERMGQLKARLADAADGWLSIGLEQVLPGAAPLEAVADNSKAGETLADDTNASEEEAGDRGAAETVADDADSSTGPELAQTASIAP